MNLILLSPFDLGLAAVLLLILAVLSWPFRLALTQPLLISAARAVVQLLLIGLILEQLFAVAHPGWIGLIAVVMIGVAGWEVRHRIQRRFRGWRGFGIGAGSMFVSSVTITLLALTVIVQADPWYQPQYAIPLLGMLLGNTMNGVALALDRLTQSVWQQRQVVEQRLLLGQSARQAISELRREAMRSGMIPSINGMAAAGLVSLPGMMTGQILSGTAPIEAVKYQLMILFLITAGSGFGIMAALWLAGRALFDERQRLRLQSLISPVRSPGGKSS